MVDDIEVRNRLAIIVQQSEDIGKNDHWVMTLPTDQIIMLEAAGQIVDNGPAMRKVRDGLVEDLIKMISTP